MCVAHVELQKEIHVLQEANKDLKQELNSREKDVMM